LLDCSTSLHRGGRMPPPCSVRVTSPRSVAACPCPRSSVALASVLSRLHMRVCEVLHTAPGKMWHLGMPNCMSLAQTRTPPERPCRGSRRGLGNPRVSQQLSGSLEGPLRLSGLFGKAPACRTRGFFCSPVFAPDATRNGNIKLATGGLRDGKPRRHRPSHSRRGRYRDLRRSPTTSGCSVKYEGVVGKLAGSALAFIIMWCGLIPRSNEGTRALVGEAAHTPKIPVAMTAAATANKVTLRI
jgi:hypothetical protein